MLTAARQDAWNHEEDLILAEVVLRHIREGSTQLAAFEEVGERLSRTAAACGFRWNSLVRKKYQSAITLAKKQRKQLKQEPSKPYSANDASEEPVLSLDDVIGYLERFRSTEQDREKMLHDNKRLRIEVDRLKEENMKLERDVDDTRKENQSIQKDYKALIAIMERARKLAVFQDGESGVTDSHEDLQKVDK